MSAVFLFMWYVYILQAKDGRLYTGITTDVERRLRAHKSGRGARFTRAFGARKIVYREEWPERSGAARRECAIKALSRREKLQLIRRGHGQGQ